jgi:ribonuclease T1
MRPSKANAKNAGNAAMIGRVVRLVAGIAFLLFAAWVVLAQEKGSTESRQKQPPNYCSDKPVKKAPQKGEAKEPAGNKSVLMKGLTLKDQDGKVVYKGDIDLAPTLERIKKGERFPHRNDGAAFGNRERRLPQKPPGYYTEYVVPTPDVRGPGPQRLVIGKEREVYYTADHYRTFKRVSVPPEWLPDPENSDKTR